MNEHITFDVSRLPSRYWLAVCSLWDNFERPSPAPGEVPWHGEAVTAEWLTAVLARDAPGARVERILVLGGDNGSSARRILGLEWNQKGRAASLPERVFTKSTPTLPPATISRPGTTRP